MKDTKKPTNNSGLYFDFWFLDFRGLPFFIVILDRSSKDEMQKVDSMEAMEPVRLC